MLGEDKMEILTLKILGTVKHYGKTLKCMAILHTLV